MLTCWGQVFAISAAFPLRRWSAVLQALGSVDWNRFTPDRNCATHSGNWLMSLPVKMSNLAEELKSLDFFEAVSSSPEKVTVTLLPT